MTAATRSEVETTRRLLEASAALSSETELEQVLQSLMRILLGMLDHTRVWVFLWDEKSRAVTLAATAGSAAVPPGMVLPFDTLSDGTREALSERRTTIVDYDALPPDKRGPAEKLGSHTSLQVPLVQRGQLVGVVSLDDPGERREFTPEQIELAEGIAAHAAVAIENARLIERLREKDADIRRAYADVIEAVTGGRLLLLTRDEVQQALGEPVEQEHEIAPGRLGEAIDWLQATLPGQFPEIEDITLLIDPAGETLTNAVKHAGGGTYQLHRKNGVAQFRVTDHGPGIDFAHLPKATLQAGYSSVGTLGIGFNAMLKNTDRVLLSTQPGETTIVLEVRAGEGSRRE